MLLARLPRLRDGAVDPADAFAGTFHVNEGYAQLERAHAQAAAGRAARRRAVRDLLPLAHRPEILGPELQAAGAQTLTLLRAAHCRRGCSPATPTARASARWRATLALARQRARRADRGLPAGATPTGARASRRARPLDLEAELGLPGGNIFHRDLAWPFAETRRPRSARWGVETDDPRVLCAARARAAAAGSAASRGQRGDGRAGAGSGGRTGPWECERGDEPQRPARRPATVREAPVVAQRGAAGGPQVIPVQRTAHPLRVATPAPRSLCPVSYVSVIGPSSACSSAIGSTAMTSGMTHGAAWRRGNTRCHATAGEREGDARSRSPLRGARPRAAAAVGRGQGSSTTRSPSGVRSSSERPVPPSTTASSPGPSGGSGSAPREYHVLAPMWW